MFRFLAHSLAVLLVTASVAGANDVTVTIKNGKLAIKGDADANQLTIDGSGLPDDTLRIQPSGGTTVNGLAGVQTFTGFVGGVTIKLGDGNDQLEVFQKTLAGKVAIDLGAGSDELEILDATVQGPSTIDLGGGDDAFAACDSLFDLDVTLKIGKGTGGTVTAECDGSLNGITAARGSAFTIYNSGLNGALTVKAVPDMHAGVIDDASIAGLLTTKNVAFLGLCYATLTRGVKATMPKLIDAVRTIDCDTEKEEAFVAEAEGNTAIAMASTSVGGPITVKGSAGAETVAIADVTVSGDLTASFAGGHNVLRFDSVTITGDLVAKAGKDTDVIDVSDFLVSGATTVKYGDGNNDIKFLVSRFEEKLSVQTGRGDDVIDLTNAQILGPAKIDAGKGNNTVTVP